MPWKIQCIILTQHGRLGVGNAKILRNITTFCSILHYLDGSPSVIIISVSKGKSKWLGDIVSCRG